MFRRSHKYILLASLLTLTGTLIFISILLFSHDSEYFSAFLRANAVELLLLVFLAVILAFTAAYLLARALVTPVTKIDPKKPEPENVYPELAPLTARLNKLSVRLDNQKDILEEGGNLRREFTANVSHELKTPLTTISGTAEILKSGLVKEADVRHFAENIYTEAQRMIVLVGDIIKLSQMDENSLPAQKEEIDLFELATDVESRLSAASAKKGVEMKVLGVHAKLNGVHQVIDEMIYNLCDNAVKYNKQNGKVTISIAENSSRVVISVADTGIGIPDDAKEHIFERFYCVDKSHSKEVGGTGLGLSIVKHGAAYHNATINLLSQLGIGTTITIGFPK